MVTFTIMQIPKDAIELRGYFTWMGKDGIARTSVKPGIDITLEFAMENTKVVTSFFSDKKFPILINSRGIKSMSYEARRHFSAQDRDTKTNAFAIVIGSTISRVLGNFYLGINKPAVPTKLFDNEEEATKWLQQFLN
ncbi:MAG: hypothetical protein IPJ60_08880 [Sphingobacteriaceae bacterium]|nr:hypothetical protein [Sphingobacteriaceae bacterium]